MGAVLKLLLQNILEKLEIEKDLGIQVDMDLRFSQHIETQVKKAVGSNKKDL